MSRFPGQAERDFQAWDSLRRQVEAQGNVIVNRERYDEMKNLLLECHAELRHAAVFVRSRQKMHPTGVYLYDALREKIGTLLGVIVTNGH